MMKYWIFSLKQDSDFSVNVCEGERKGEKRGKMHFSVCYK